MGNRILTDTFEKLQQKLHFVACRMLGGDEADAADAVQDTFLNLWNARMPETSDEARFRLFAVLRNVCISQLRRRRVTVPIDDAPPSVCEININETNRITPILLATLTPLQRQIFTMSAFDDIEYDIIASRLGISVDSVRTNMCRARKKVREQYLKLQK